ncbi:hypothetical protein HanRHA438_Chr09g0378511 [Helianthus annuus]|nr:hypothetical protein HanRHA438_Chr09g0378511 [Helianthus annuus]
MEACFGESNWVFFGYVFFSGRVRCARVQPGIKFYGMYLVNTDRARNVLGIISIFYLCTSTSNAFIFRRVSVSTLSAINSDILSLPLLGVIYPAQATFYLVSLVSRILMGSGYGVMVS